jgi:hypothetical protein
LKSHAETWFSSTGWRRLQDWEEQEVWLEIWRAFLSELNERQRLQWSESFLDGSFVSAKKGRWSCENQEGERHEVDGGGRRQGCSFGETTFTLRPRRKSNSRPQTLATIRVRQRHHPRRPWQKPERVVGDHVATTATLCGKSWPDAAWS